VRAGECAALPISVVRAMPNTPSTVHEGIAGLCAGAHAGDEHLDLAEEALAHLGSVVRVAEKSMDAITAVSGSGPAYFALLAEAMIEAGILLGLSREISTQLVVQTMLGTFRVPAEQELDEGLLKAIAEKTGGFYSRADDADSLRKIVKKIDELEKTEVKSVQYMQYVEHFGWWTLPALALLGLEMLAGCTVFRKIP
jgi:hypothetical protein